MTEEERALYEEKLRIQAVEQRREKQRFLKDTLTVCLRVAVPIDVRYTNYLCCDRKRRRMSRSLRKRTC